MHQNADWDWLGRFGVCVTRFLLLLKDPKGTAAQDASAEQQIKVHQISAIR